MNLWRTLWKWMKGFPVDVGLLGTDGVGLAPTGSVCTVLRQHGRRMASLRQALGVSSAERSGLARTRSASPRRELGRTLSAGLVEQFLGSCFHRFPPLRFDFNRRLPYNISQIIFSRKGPGWGYFTKDFYKCNSGSDLGGFRPRRLNNRKRRIPYTQ